MRRDLVDITSRLAALPGLRTLAMTSNGIALKRQLPQVRRRCLRDVGGHCKWCTLATGLREQVRE